jgi:hypothetical protein
LLIGKPKEIYVQNARDEVQQWQRKLHDFNENTRTSKANMRTKASVPQFGKRSKASQNERRLASDGLI